MKRIFKELKKHKGFYLRYMVIVTDEIIELKITPLKNEDQEQNWINYNTQDGKACMAWAIFKYFEHINKEQST